jgi:excisionase family DNA binding protein
MNDLNLDSRTKSAPRTSGLARPAAWPAQTVSRPGPRPLAGGPSTAGAGPHGAEVPETAAVPFPSLLFPKDRTVLGVPEVARRLRVTEQHVVNLIEHGRLRAVNLGASASPRRRYYRIPVEAWEAYLKENLL